MGDPLGARRPEDFFAGHPDGLALFTAVRQVVEQIGPCDVRVTKSQVAFRRARGFAYVWRPAQYVTSGTPAVLSIALPQPLTSPRFKSVVHPSPRVWMHHLELFHPDQVDDEVRAWLTSAYEHAGDERGRRAIR